MRLTNPDGDSPAPPSRRLVAASLFTAGYALAVGPAAAQAITTPTDGLEIEEARVRGYGAYALPIYVAKPRDGDDLPAIIVVNEIFGIHAYIRDVCHRLAREGYVAIAPDYFDRAGDPSTMTDWGAIRSIVAQTRYAQVMGDTAGVLDWAARRRYVDDAKLGITGFCWGGAVTWMAAASFAPLKAGVAWYGRLVAPDASGFGAEEGRPWPVDVAGQLKCPVLGLYAENDDGIPLASVEAMRAALDAERDRTHSQIIVYPGAAHGFHADYRPSYNANAAADGWSRLLAWMRTHGVG